MYVLLSLLLPAGAGKSSILAALLRLRPIESGSIFVMGDDSSTLSLHDLRGRLGVVPQNPVIFSGTLRDNLDPAAAATDEELAAALQVGCKYLAYTASVVLLSNLLVRTSVSRMCVVLYMLVITCCIELLCWIGLSLLCEGVTAQQQ